MRRSYPLPDFASKNLFNQGNDLGATSTPVPEVVAEASRIETPMESRTPALAPDTASDPAIEVKSTLEVSVDE